MQKKKRRRSPIHGHVDISSQRWHSTVRRLPEAVTHRTVPFICIPSPSPSKKSIVSSLVHRAHNLPSWQRLKKWQDRSHRKTAGNQRLPSFFHQARCQWCQKANRYLKSRSRRSIKHGRTPRWSWRARQWHGRIRWWSWRARQWHGQTRWWSWWARQWHGRIRWWSWRARQWHGQTRWWSWWARQWCRQTQDNDHLHPVRWRHKPTDRTDFFETGYPDSAIASIMEMDHLAPIERRHGPFFEVWSGVRIDLQWLWPNVCRWNSSEFRETREWAQSWRVQW